MGKLFHRPAADRASPLRYRKRAVKQRHFNDLLTAIGKKPRATACDGTRP
jgi:hypothetical protein